MQTEDLPGVLDLMEAAFGEMQYVRVGRTFDRTTVLRNLTAVLAKPECCCRVVEGNGRIIGVLVLTLVRSLMDWQHVQAVELVWHAHPALHVKRRIRIMLALWDDMVTAARMLEARTLHVSVPAGDSGEGLRRFLANRGADVAETVCVKVLKQ